MLNYAWEKRKKIVKSALKCVEFTFLRLTIEIALYLLIQPAWAIGFVQRNFHWYCYGRLHLTGQTLLSPSKSSHPINISVRYQRIHHTTNRVFIFKYMLIPNYTQIWQEKKKGLWNFSFWNETNKLCDKLWYQILWWWYCREKVLRKMSPYCRWIRRWKL